MSANLITQVIHPVVQHIQVATIIQNAVDVMNKHYLSKAEKFFNLAKMKAYMLKLIEDKLKAEELASAKPKIVEVTDSETSPVSIKENDIKSVLDSIQNVRNRLKSKKKETEPVDLRRKYSIDNVKPIVHSKTSSTTVKTAMNFAEGNEGKIIEEAKENKKRRFTVENEKIGEKKRDGLNFEKDWFLKKSKCAEKLFSKNYSEGRVVSEDLSNPGKSEDSPTDVLANEKNVVNYQLGDRDEIIPSEAQKVLIYDEFPSFSEKYPYDDKLNKIEKESQEKEIENKDRKEPKMFDMKNIKESLINANEKPSINKLPESFQNKIENEKDFIIGRPSQNKSTKASYFPQKFPPSLYAKNAEGEEIPKPTEPKSNDLQSVKPKSRVSSDFEELKEQNKVKLNEKSELSEEINEDPKNRQADYRPERQKYFDPKTKDEQDIISKYLNKRIKKSNEDDPIEENIIEGIDLKKEKPVVSVKYQQEALNKKIKIEPEENFEDRPKISKLRTNLEKGQAKTNLTSNEDEIGKQTLKFTLEPIKSAEVEIGKQTSKTDAMPAKLTDRISYRLPDKNKSEFEIKRDDPLLIPRGPKSSSISEVKEEDIRKDSPVIPQEQSSSQNLRSHSSKSNIEIKEDSNKFNNQAIKSKVDESESNIRKAAPFSGISDSKNKDTEKIEMEPYKLKESSIKPAWIESDREKFNPNKKEVEEKNKLPIRQKNTFGLESYREEEIYKSTPISQKQMLNTQAEESRINKDMPKEIFSQNNLLEEYVPGANLTKEIIGSSNELDAESRHFLGDPKNQAIEEEIQEPESTYSGKPLIKKQLKAQRTSKQSSQLNDQIQEEAKLLPKKEESFKGDSEPALTKEDKIKIQEKSLEKASEIPSKTALNPSKGKSLGKEALFYPLKPSSSNITTVKDKRGEEEPDQIILKRSESKKLSNSSKSSGSYKTNEDLSNVREKLNREKINEKMTDERKESPIFQKDNFEYQSYSDELLQAAQKEAQNKNSERLNQYEDNPKMKFTPKNILQQNIDPAYTNALTETPGYFIYENLETPEKQTLEEIKEPELIHSEKNITQKNILQQNIDSAYKNTPTETPDYFIYENLEAPEKRTLEEIKEPELIHSKKNIIETQVKIQSASQQPSQLIDQDQKDADLINLDSDTFLPTDKILKSYGAEKQKDFFEKTKVDPYRIYEKAELLKDDNKSAFFKEDKFNAQEVSLENSLETKEKTAANSLLGKSIEGEMTIYSSKLSNPSRINEKERKEEEKSHQFVSEQSESPNLSFHSHISSDSINAPQRLKENKLEEISTAKSIYQNTERKIDSKENNVYTNPTNVFSEIRDIQDKTVAEIGIEPNNLSEDPLVQGETIKHKLNEKITDEIYESPAFKQNVSARFSYEEDQVEKSIPTIKNKVQNIKDEELSQIKDTSKQGIYDNALIQQNAELYDTTYKNLQTENKSAAVEENKSSVEVLQEQTFEEEIKDAGSAELGKVITKKHQKPQRTAKQSSQLISQEAKGAYSKQEKTGKAKDKDEFSFIEEEKSRIQDFALIDSAELSEKSAVDSLKGKSLETEKLFDPLKLTSLSEENKKGKEDEPIHQLDSKISSHSPSKSYRQTKALETLEEKKIEENFAEIFDNKNKKTTKIDTDSIKMREDSIQSLLVEPSNDQLNKVIESPIYQKNILELEKEVDESILKSKKQIKDMKTEELRENKDSPIDIFSQGNAFQQKPELVKPEESLKSDTINLLSSGSLDYSKEPQKQRIEEENKDSESTLSKGSVAKNQQETQRSEEKSLQFASQEPKGRDSIYLSQDKRQILKDKGESRVYKEDYVASLLINQPKNKSIEKEKSVDPLNSSSSSEKSEKGEEEAPHIMKKHSDSESSSLDLANSSEQFEDAEISEEEKVENIITKTDDSEKQRIAKENDITIRTANPFSERFADKDKNTDKADKKSNELRESKMKPLLKEIYSDKFQLNERETYEESEKLALQEYISNFREEQKDQSISKNQNSAGYQPNKNLPIETFYQSKVFQQNTEISKSDESLPAEAITSLSSKELHSSEITRKQEIEENNKSEPIEPVNVFIEKAKEPQISGNQSPQFTSKESKETDYGSHFQESEKSKPAHSISDIIATEKEQKSKEELLQYLNTEKKDTGSIYFSQYKDSQDKGEIFKVESEYPVFQEDKAQIEDVAPEKVFELSDKSIINKPKSKFIGRERSVDPLDSSGSSEVGEKDEEKTPQAMQKYSDSDSSSLDQANSCDQIEDAEISEEEKLEDIITKTDHSKIQRLAEKNISTIRTENPISEIFVDKDKNVTLADMRSGKLIENPMKHESAEPATDQLKLSYSISDEEKEISAAELESVKDIQKSQPTSANQTQIDVQHNQNAPIITPSQSNEFQTLFEPDKNSPTEIIKSLTSQNLPGEAINLLGFDNLFASKGSQEQTIAEEIKDSESAQSKIPIAKSQQATQRGEKQYPRFIGKEPTLAWPSGTSKGTEPTDTESIFFSQYKDSLDKGEVFKDEGESPVFQENKTQIEDVIPQKVLELLEKGTINQPKSKYMERENSDPSSHNSSSELSEKDEEEAKLMLKHQDNESSNFTQRNSGDKFEAYEILDEKELKEKMTEKSEDPSTKLTQAENHSNIKTANEPSPTIFDKDNATMTNMNFNKIREEPASIESSSNELKINEKIIGEEIEENISDLENYENKQKSQLLSTNIIQVELKQHKDVSLEEFSPKNESQQNIDVLKPEEDFTAKTKISLSSDSLKNPEESQEQVIIEEIKEPKPAHSEKAIIKKQKKPQRSEKKSSQYISQERKDADFNSSYQDKSLQEAAEKLNDENKSTAFEEDKIKTQDATLENISSISSPSALNLSKSEPFEKEALAYSSKLASSSKVSEKDKEEPLEIIQKKSDIENLYLDPKNPSGQFEIAEASEEEKLYNSVSKKSADLQIISITEKKDSNIRTASPLSDTFSNKTKNDEKANVELFKLGEEPIKPYSGELSGDEIKINEKITDEVIENIAIPENILVPDCDEEKKTIKSPIKSQNQAKIKSSSIFSSNIKFESNEELANKSAESLTSQENALGLECCKEEQHGKSLLESHTQIKSSSIEPSSGELKENEKITAERIENPASLENITESEYDKNEKVDKTISTGSQSKIKSSLTEQYSEEFKQNENAIVERVENPASLENITESEYDKNEKVDKAISTGSQSKIKSSLTEQYSEEFKQNKNAIVERIENPTSQENLSGPECYKDEEMGKSISIKTQESQPKIKSLLAEQSSEEFKQNENIIADRIEKPSSQENLSGSECYKDEEMGRSISIKDQAQIISSFIEPSSEEFEQNQNIIADRIEKPSSQENVSGSERRKDESIGKPILTKIQSQIQSSLIEPSSEEFKQNENITEEDIKHHASQENVSESERRKDESIGKPILTKIQTQLESSLIEPSSEEFKQNENITEEDIKHHASQENVSRPERRKDEPINEPILTKIQTQIKSSLIEPSSKEFKQNENITEESIKHHTNQEYISRSEKQKDESIDKPILTKIQTQLESSLIEPSSKEFKQNENISDESIKHHTNQEYISGSEKQKDESIDKPILKNIQTQIKSSLIEPSREEWKQNENITNEDIKHHASQENISESERRKDESVDKPIQSQIKSSLIEPSSEECKQNENITDEGIKYHANQENISVPERRKDEPIFKPILAKTQTQIESSLTKPYIKELKQNENAADEEIENSPLQENISENKVIEPENMEKSILIPIDSSSIKLVSNEKIADQSFENLPIQEKISVSESSGDEQQSKFPLTSYTKINSSSIESSSEELKQNESITAERIESPASQENILESERHKDERISKPTPTKTQAQIKSSLVEPSSEEFKENETLTDEAIENPENQKNISGDEKMGQLILTKAQAQIESSLIEPSSGELKQNESITDKEIKKLVIQENNSELEIIGLMNTDKPISATQYKAPTKLSSEESSSSKLKLNKNIYNEEIKKPIFKEQILELESYEEEQISKALEPKINADKQISETPADSQNQTPINSLSIESSSEILDLNKSRADDKTEILALQEYISSPSSYRDEPISKTIPTSQYQISIKSPPKELSSDVLKMNENTIDDISEIYNSQENILSERYINETTAKNQYQTSINSWSPESSIDKQDKTDEKIEDLIQEESDSYEEPKSDPEVSEIFADSQYRLPLSEIIEESSYSSLSPQSKSIFIQDVFLRLEYLRILQTLRLSFIQFRTHATTLIITEIFDLAGDAIAKLIRKQLESSFNVLYANTILLQKERNNKLKVILENSITRFDHILLRSLSSWKLKTVHKIYEEKMGIHHHQTEENLMNLRTQTHIRSFVEVIEKKVLAKEFYAFSVFLAIFNRYKVPKDSEALKIMSFTQTIDSHALGQFKYCMNILKLANRKSKQELKKKEIGLEMLFKAIRRYTKTTKQHSWVRWRLYMRTKNYKAEYTSYGLRRFSDILKRQIIVNYQDFLEQLKLISSYKAEGASLMVQSISSIINSRCRPLFKLSYLYKKQNKVLRQLLRTQRIRSNAALKENLRTWRLNSKFNTQIKKELLDVFTKLAFSPFKSRKSFAFSRIKAEFSSINSNKAKKEKAAKTILNLYRRISAKILQRSVHLWGSFASEMKRLESYEQLLRTKFSKRLLLLIIRSWSRIKGRKRRICRGLELLGKLFSIRVCEYFQTLNENDPSFIWSMNDESLVKFDVALIAPYLKSMIMNFHSHHKYFLKESFDRWKFAKSISHDKNVTLALEISHAFNKKKHKLLWESWHILRNPRFSMTYKQKMKLRSAIEKWESVMYRPQNLLLEAFFTWKRGPKEEQLTRLKQYKQYFSS
ncbi:unnamed protein product [Blepharisma stoltei]|uniref:Uncharacterized protein n=1 Tax=Blepharisma stoltei TaxID=1481888 RepID=A0AAU9JB87_9CILI|nr:unnamed protein product [Blepharisma stoltei]